MKNVIAITAAVIALAGCVDNANTPVPRGGVVAAITDQAPNVAAKPVVELFAGEMCKLPAQTCSEIAAWDRPNGRSSAWSSEQLAIAKALYTKVDAARVDAYATCENKTSIRTMNNLRAKTTGVGYDEILPNGMTQFFAITVLSTSKSSCTTPPRGTVVFSQ